MPLNKSKPIIEGDELTLACKSINKDDGKIFWQWIPKLNNGNNAVPIEKYSTGIQSGLCVFPFYYSHLLRNC